MKRAVLLLSVVMIIFSLAGCGNMNKPDAEGAAVIEEGQSAATGGPGQQAGDEEREPLYIYYDGEPINGEGYVYADIQGVMADKEIDGTCYFGASVADIAGEKFSDAKGAFLEAVDGYISYVPDVDNLYLAAYIVEGGEYQSVVLDGGHVYGGVTAGGMFNKGVNSVYLISTPAEFSVEIQKNGEKIGLITMDDFMKKTPIDGKKISTAMYDGSFMYQGGAATYEGRFLGIDFETMMAKLAALGMDLSGNIIEIEYYGTGGTGAQGKNEEYSLTEGEPKFCGSVEFFCMFDGKTYNDITSDCALGLTAFINGTGGRWMTYDLTAINFKIEES